MGAGKVISMLTSCWLVHYMFILDLCYQGNILCFILLLHSPFMISDNWLLSSGGNDKGKRYYLAFQAFSEIFCIFKSTFCLGICHYSFLQNTAFVHRIMHFARSRPNMLLINPACACLGTVQQFSLWAADPNPTVSPLTPLAAHGCISPAPAS